MFTDHTVLQNALDYEIAVLQNWIMRLQFYGILSGLRHTGTWYV